MAQEFPPVRCQAYGAGTLPFVGFELLPAGRDNRDTLGSIFEELQGIDALHEPARPEGYDGRVEIGDYGRDLGVGGQAFVFAIDMGSDQLPDPPVSPQTAFTHQDESDGAQAPHQEIQELEIDPLPEIAHESDGRNGFGGGETVRATRPRPQEPGSDGIGEVMHRFGRAGLPGSLKVAGSGEDMVHPSYQDPLQRPGPGRRESEFGMLVYAIVKGGSGPDACDGMGVGKRAAGSADEVHHSQPGRPLADQARDDPPIEPVAGGQVGAEPAREHRTDRQDVEAVGLRAHLSLEKPARAADQGG
jgi:hypothetical protein